MEKINQLLLQEKKEILSKSLPDELDASGDETDIIQAKIIMTVSSRLASRDKERLEKIEAALLKIQNNNYGNCDDCGEEISEKRLLVNPQFETCISCAHQREMNSKK
jgi:DnaK suppressor protein